MVFYVKKMILMIALNVEINGKVRNSYTFFSARKNVIRISLAFLIPASIF